MGTGNGLKDETMWLVEATRYLEEAQAVVDETAALAKARKTDAAIEKKIAVRAENLSSATVLKAERLALKRLVKFCVLAAILVFFISGAFAARAGFAVKDGNFVNIYWLLISLLGVHIIGLVLWAGGLIFGSGGLLGHWVSDSISFLARRLKAGPVRLAAVRAMMKRNMRGKSGLWYSSALSHSLWAAYLLGACFAIFLSLATQRYVFIWETTILSSQDYQALTHVLSLLPQALRIPMPDASIVQASEWPVANGALGDAHLLWSNFLFAVVVLYGLLPRLFLYMLSLFMGRVQKARLKLDLNRPLYARLIPLIHPVVTETHIVDGDDEPVPETPVAQAHTDIPAMEPERVALLGWELDEPGGGWPPKGFGGLDLGLCEERQQLNTLLTKAKQAGRLVVVMSARPSPDRGVRAVLAEIVTQMGQERVFVLMIDAPLLAEKSGDSVAQARLGDWLSAAYQAGVSEKQFIIAEFDAPILQNLWGKTS